MPSQSVHAIVTDPPYGLRFMGRRWDYELPDIAIWRECLRVLKPGGHLLAMGGSRTAHRLTVSVEDAGFELRDTLMFLYATGFPKSLDVSKAIDKAAGAAREKVRPRSVIAHQRNIGNRRPYMDDPDHMTVSDDPATPEAAAWQGWGTALKPSYESITLARKPLIGTVAENVLAHSVGGINVDACRVPTRDRLGGGGEQAHSAGKFTNEGWRRPWMDHPEASEAFAAKVRGNVARAEELGRWPANVLHDGSDEVLESFSAFGESGPRRASARGVRHSGRHSGLADLGGNIKPGTNSVRGYDAAGGTAARFFYTAKASKLDRCGSRHPTVKPLALMRWLCRLVCPPGGVILDPFAGSGTTGEAAHQEGFDCILIEREAAYVADIRRRIQRCQGCDGSSGAPEASEPGTTGL